RPLTGLLHSITLEGVLGVEADPGAVFRQLVEQAIGAGDPRVQHANAANGRPQQAGTSHLPPSLLAECWLGSFLGQHGPPYCCSLAHGAFAQAPPTFGFLASASRRSRPSPASRPTGGGARSLEPG